MPVNGAAKPTTAASARKSQGVYKPLIRFKDRPGPWPATEVVGQSDDIRYSPSLMDGTHRVYTEGSRGVTFAERADAVAYAQAEVDQRRKDFEETVSDGVESALKFLANPRWQTPTPERVQLWFDGFKRRSQYNGAAGFLYGVTQDFIDAQIARVAEVMPAAIAAVTEATEGV
jgi:hypothetical protein